MCDVLTRSNHWRKKKETNIWYILFFIISYPSKVNLPIAGHCSPLPATCQWFHAQKKSCRKTNQDISFLPLFGVGQVKYLCFSPGHLEKTWFKRTNIESGRCGHYGVIVRRRRTRFINLQSSSWEDSVVARWFLRRSKKVIRKDMLQTVHMRKQ